MMISICLCLLHCHVIIIYFKQFIYHRNSSTQDIGNNCPQSWGCCKWWPPLHDEFKVIIYKKCIWDDRISPELLIIYSESLKMLKDKISSMIAKQLLTNVLGETCREEVLCCRRDDRGTKGWKRGDREVVYIKKWK